MFLSSIRRRFSGLFAFVYFALAVLEATELEGRPQTVRVLCATLVDLAWKGKIYLGRLVGEETFLSVEKNFSQVMGVVAESVADNLNTLPQHISQFLQTSGIQVGLPINKVTPEGLIFIAQWLLKVLICYYLISHVFQLVGWLLRVTLWLLRAMVACLVPEWSRKLFAWRSKLKSWPQLKALKRKKNDVQKQKSVK